MEKSPVAGDHIFTSLDSSLHDIDDFHQVHASAVVTPSPSFSIEQSGLTKEPA